MGGGEEQVVWSELVAQLEKIGFAKTVDWTRVDTGGDDAEEVAAAERLPDGHMATVANVHEPVGHAAPR